MYELIKYKNWNILDVTKTILDVTKTQESTKAIKGEEESRTERTE